MKALKLIMKDCERGILSGTFEPTLDWAKEVLEVYNKEDSEVFERLGTSTNSCRTSSSILIRNYILPT